VKKAKLLKPDAHRNRRNQELFREWTGEKLKHLIVTGLVKGADRCRYLFIDQVEACSRHKWPQLRMRP
jgi:hypothetical protein